ncbi:hypothetical protein [Luteolibacter marinus]|uniref:hypothetical protein n=1 Tax=Luteolibacter marinus TaxID=2776705 RepID=UPI0018667CFD|nr:hypothetical protein [Luteolibacter marinus]
MRCPAFLLFPPLLSSCGLIQLPFKVAGQVVEGTAEVGKMTYDSAAKPFKKTPEEKAEAEKKKAQEKARKEAEKKAKEQPAVQKDAAKPDDDNLVPAEPEYLPLPGTDDPLPDDAPLPYQGEP